MTLLAILFICGVPIALSFYLAGVIRTVEKTARTIQEFPARVYKFTNTEDTTIPRAVQRKFPELEALGFKFYGCYWCEYPSGVKGVTSTCYVMLDEQRSTQAVLNVRNTAIGNQVYPTFETYFDDRYFTHSFFGVPFGSMLMTKRVGPVEITWSHGSAASVYAGHKERVAEAMQQVKRSLAVVNQEKDLIDVAAAFDGQYGVEILSTHLKNIILFFLCGFGLLATMTLRSIFDFSDTSLHFMTKALDAVLMVLSWGGTLYLAFRLITLRDLLFGKKSPFQE